MPDDQLREAMRAMVLVSQLGLTMVLPVVAGVFVGRWVDGAVGFGPWGAVGGIGLGVVLGGTGVWELLKKATREAPEDDSNDKKD